MAMSYGMALMQKHKQDDLENLNRQQAMGSIMNPLQEMGMGEASKVMGKWAGGTELGQKYSEFTDKGGLLGGEGSKLSKTGDFLSSYLPSWLEQVPEVDHTDPETGEPGVSY